MSPLGLFVPVALIEMILLMVPEPILFNILWGFLNLKDNGRLDASCCNASIRSTFLQALSSGIVRYPVSLKVKSYALLSWIYTRAIRAEALSLEGQCQVTNETHEESMRHWWSTAGMRVRALAIVQPPYLRMNIFIANNCKELLCVCFNYIADGHSIAFILQSCTKVRGVSLARAEYAEQLIKTLPELCLGLEHLHLSSSSSLNFSMVSGFSGLRSFYGIYASFVIDDSSEAPLPLQELSVQLISDELAQCLAQRCPHLQFLAALRCSCSEKGFLQLQSLRWLQTAMFGILENKYSEIVTLKLVDTIPSLRKFHCGVKVDTEELEAQHRAKVVEKTLTITGRAQDPVPLGSSLTELIVPSLSLFALQSALQSCPHLHTLHLENIANVSNADLPQYFALIEDSRIRSLTLHGINHACKEHVRSLRNFHALDLKFDSSVSGSVDDFLACLAVQNKDLREMKLELISSYHFNLQNLPKAVMAFPHLVKLCISEVRDGMNSARQVALKQALQAFRPQLQDVILMLMLG